MLKSLCECAERMNITWEMGIAPTLMRYWCSKTVESRTCTGTDEILVQGNSGMLRFTDAIV